MSKKMRVIVILGSVMVLLAAGYGIYYFRRMQNYKSIINQITIHDVDLSTVEDGEYIGEKDADIIGAKVKVTVKDHKIEKIDLEHRNDRGEKAEVIPQRIIQQQKISVDAVSGATNSSKVIQKAVETALVGDSNDSD
ncbi:FMN-binding protein [Enterococcus florum]|uniref:FMN-binding protein n=1 Tax=Enterococcus florum TaxID=2480627 RepID=A0A4P5P8L3_9ENTE|nr:FMN-binding protein [Enterococcus florum]GCF94190.1 FMN-binding protein [Enterococcus florum]